MKHRQLRNNVHSVWKKAYLSQDFVAEDVCFSSRVGGKVVAKSSEPTEALPGSSAISAVWLERSLIRAREPYMNLKLSFIRGLKKKFGGQIAACS